MLLFGLAEFTCLVVIVVSLLGIIIKGIKKSSGKKKLGLAALIALVVLIILVANTPDSVKESSREKKEQKQQMQLQEDSNTEDKKDETVTSDENDNVPETTVDEPSVEEKTETEKFAERYGVSVTLAENIDEVLSGMELTDKSRVGVFHYTIADVKSWKKLDDWAEGERYSGYMAEEHVWYFYIKDDALVGVRDGNGNIFYSQE